MRTQEFFKQLDHDRIVNAIRDAEKRTSGEIRVFISHKKVEDPMTAAEARFNQLGMEKTHLRNGVLIFVAPRSQAYAIIGDQGVHQKCGDGFWREVGQLIKEEFSNRKFTNGIVVAIERAGNLLSEHFPRKADDSNELPDSIAHD
jgi:uncharacterized membrane protein